MMVLDYSIKSNMYGFFGAFFVWVSPTPAIHEAGHWQVCDRSVQEKACHIVLTEHPESLTPPKLRMLTALLYGISHDRATLLYMEAKPRLVHQS